MFKALLVVLSQIFITPQLISAPENSSEIEMVAQKPAETVAQQIEKTRKTLAVQTSSNGDVLSLFDQVVEQWEKQSNEQANFEIQKLLNAVEFAAIHHNGQTRKDVAKTPYIIHPIGVAKSLWEEGKVRNTDVLTAALLHDTLEDTKITGKDIERHFGSSVRLIVEEVTNDPKLSTQENKQRQIDKASQLSPNAKLVKLADRLNNVRDLRKLPADWGKMDVLRYLYWGDRLLYVLKGTNSTLEKALEREILEQLAANKI
jgi:guanosine-3',5'-bis(diphosphate) 3'-pyrophosphohydrolase